jgi:hypothetical protein
MRPSAKIKAIPSRLFAIPISMTPTCFSAGRTPRRRNMSGRGDKLLGGIINNHQEETDA